MWELLRSRIAFYSRARTSYDIQSPFLFDFIKNVLDTDKDYYRFSEIEALRSKLLSSDQSIEITDHGAGSRRLHNTRRKISDIARSSLSSPQKCRVLFNIAHHYQRKKILELGTSLGISSSYLAVANSNASVYTIEGDSRIAGIAQEIHKQAGLDNIRVIQGTFENKLDDVLESIGCPDLIYIDGHHTKEATLRYFEKVIQYTNKQSILLFDDIYWSKGMQEAWEIITKSREVTLCVDLFYLGVVFLNTDLQKEVFHYIPYSYKPWRIGLFQ
jgi:predicted O-methyltransferase YrrM